ncbi:hypothetical protein NIES4101_72290 [Calothrix sp. NIES-4101]|nr:hypothetical protein NIES4101_72290 [Calothrix sp. NIES-4101]
MEFTGERYIPSVGGKIKYEHLHRYAICLDFVSQKAVLDIASGEGYGSALLANVAASVIGVDIDSESIDYAKAQYANHHNLQFLVGSCESIPLPDKSVDVVTSFETLEHHNHHEEMMQEIKRVLKPDGILIISSPNKLAYSDEANYSNPFHVKELYYEELVDLLSRYFNHNKFYGQKMTSSSFLLPLIKTEAISLTAFTGSDNYVEKRICSSQSPDYFIVVCSDVADAVKPCLTSLYVDDSEDLFKTFEMGWIHEGEKSRNYLLQQQKTQLELEKKEQQLHDTLAESQKKTYQYQKELGYLREKIVEMENSKFWKLREIWFSFQRIMKK